MQKILQAILNFFRSIFGGNSASDVNYIPPLPENPQPLPEKPKAPTEISVLPQTPVTETPEAPVTPKPPKDKPTVTPKPPITENPKPPITENPKPVITEKPTVTTEPVKDTTKPIADANTLIIKLERYSLGEEDILGKLIIGDQLVCYTLEDKLRDEKVKGETCIPLGEYEITLRNLGAMNDTYQRRYSTMHKGMLWLRNIPKFEYILIHIGNTSADTKGCILVGTKPENESNTQMRRAISGSNAAYQKVYPIIAEHLSKGGKAIIRITN